MFLQNNFCMLYKQQQWPSIYKERLLLLVHAVVRTCMQTSLTAWSAPQFARASAATGIWYVHM